MPQVGLVLFEGQSYPPASGGYLDTLSGSYRKFTNYKGTQQPSLPDYGMLTAGSWLGKTGTDNGSDGFAGTTASIFSQLVTNGNTWKAYEQGVTGHYTFWTSGVGTAKDPNGSGNYCAHHSPACFFTNTMAAGTGGNGRYDFDQLVTDITNKTLPDYFFITPNNNNSGHDTNAAFVDNWASGANPDGQPAAFKFPGIGALISAMRSDGILVVTYDNSAGSWPNPGAIYCIVAGPNVAASTVSTAYNHANLLYSIQTKFGLAKLSGGDAPYTASLSTMDLSTAAVTTVRGSTIGGLPLPLTGAFWGADDGNGSIGLFTGSHGIENAYTAASTSGGLGRRMAIRRRHYRQSIWGPTPGNPGAAASFNPGTATDTGGTAFGVAEKQDCLLSGPNVIPCVVFGSQGSTFPVKTTANQNGLLSGGKPPESGNNLAVGGHLGMDRITAGEFDADMIAIANTIASFVDSGGHQVPTLVIPWQEMNIPAMNAWGAFQGGVRADGTGAGQTSYINAFNHFAAILRAHAPNAIIGWCPTYYDEPDGVKLSYYPGDTYVDVIWEDVYDININSTSTHQQVTDIYNFAVNHNKPFGVAESGVAAASNIPTMIQNHQAQCKNATYADNTLFYLLWSEGTYLYYQVAGSNSQAKMDAYHTFANDSYYSAVYAGFSGTDNTPPTTPTNFAGTAVSYSEIDLSWTVSTDPGSPSSGVQSYNIFSDNGSGGALVSAYTVTGGSSTTLNAQSLTGNTTYKFKIQAVDGAANKSPFSSTISVTTPLHLQLITTITAPVSPLVTFQHVGLTPNTTYEYVVEALDAAANSSGPSNTTTATTTSNVKFITVHPVDTAIDSFVDVVNQGFVQNLGTATDTNNTNSFNLTLARSSKKGNLIVVSVSSNGAATTGSAITDNGPGLTWVKSAGIVQGNLTSTIFTAVAPSPSGLAAGVILNIAFTNPVPLKAASVDEVTGVVPVGYVDRVQTVSGTTNNLSTIQPSITSLPISQNSEFVWGTFAVATPALSTDNDWIPISGTIRGNTVSAGSSSFVGQWTSYISTTTATGGINTSQTLTDTPNSVFPASLYTGAMITLKYGSSARVVPINLTDSALGVAGGIGETLIHRVTRPLLDTVFSIFAPRYAISDFAIGSGGITDSMILTKLRKVSDNAISGGGITDSVLMTPTINSVPIAFVQGANTSDSNVADTSFSITVPATTTGNALVLAIACITKTRTITGVVDSAANNGWVQLTGGGATGAGSAFLWFCPNAQSVTSITVNYSGAQKSSIVFAEFAGLGTTKDVSTFTNNTVASTNPSSSGTTTKAREVILAAVGSAVQASSVAGGFTFPASLKSISANGLAICLAYDIVAATGTYTATWTLPSSVVNTVAIASIPAPGQ